MVKFFKERKEEKKENFPNKSTFILWNPNKHEK